MNLLKPTCYLFFLLNDGEVHKWIGGVKKGREKYNGGVLPSVCVCVLKKREREMGGGALEKSTKVEPV